MQPIEPLPASARQSDPDYAGVVAPLGDGFRLAVSMCGRRYILQQFCETADGWRWMPAGGKCPGKLDRIAAKYAGQVDGLAALCAALPDDPALVAADFLARRAALLAVFEARDITRPDYARVAAVNGTLRVVVAPDASAYVLQWVKLDQVHQPEAWHSLKRLPTLSGMSAYMFERVGLIVGPGRAGVLRREEIASDIAELLAGLPELPGDGVWPFVPAVPATPQA